MLVRRARTEKLSGDRMLIYAPINPREAHIWITCDISTYSHIHMLTHTHCVLSTIADCVHERNIRCVFRIVNVHILVALLYLLLRSVIKTSDLQAASISVMLWNRNFCASTSGVLLVKISLVTFEYDLQIK